MNKKGIWSCGALVAYSFIAARPSAELEATLATSLLGGRCKQAQPSSLLLSLAVHTLTVRGIPHQQNSPAAASCQGQFATHAA